LTGLVADRAVRRQLAVIRHQKGRDALVTPEHHRRPRPQVPCDDPGIRDVGGALLVQVGRQLVEHVPSLDQRMDVDLVEYPGPPYPLVDRREQRHLDLAVPVGQQRRHRRQQPGTRRPAMNLAVPIPYVRQRNPGVQMDDRRPQFPADQLKGRGALLMLCR
jgi:hypothetical protein